MSTQKSSPVTFYTLILYICGFILFLEWFYPLQEVTDTTNISMFMLYGVLCFLLSFMQVRWWLSFILKGAALLFVVNSLFFTTSFLNPLWIGELLQDSILNTQALFNRTWYEFTPLFRSTMFLILIWLMSYLLHYWFVIRKRVFMFVFLTIAYLAVLDTFTVYDGTAAIIRSFIISLLALGLAHFMREMDREALRFTLAKKSAVWLLPLVAIVLFSSAVGLAAPKFSPQWPDPVPFIQSSAENAGFSGEGNGGIQKVGYGEDDSRLGGSFVQDYTPVFEAEADEEHYWRVETKDVYTGKGWEKSHDSAYTELGKIPPMFQENVNLETKKATIEFQGDEALDKLVYPYGFDHVEAPEGEPYFDMSSEAIQLMDDANDPITLENYTVDYGYPTFQIEALQQASSSDNSMEAYTQIPETLPDRVIELAKDITAEKETQYDKAKAIESYFSSTDFTYQTTDVPVPEANEDYVDQFLFDSRAGYCDNFSTSMVVMLRSLDVPARWAKGFTGGELVDAGSEKNTYEITNSNAHSWVEVYFPGSGWVPFEPTKGFSNLSDFQNEPISGETQQQDSLQQSEQETEDEEQSEETTPEEEKEEESEVASAAASNSGPTAMEWMLPTVIGIALLLIVFILVYRSRLRLQSKWVRRKFTADNNVENQQEAYHFLMKVLQKQGEAKRPGETLREYAMKIDKKYETTDMQKLTEHYERLIYRDDDKLASKTEVAQLWKNLIKRILS
ncbi:transglutaminase TgpA family protein [Virgibacillus dokdonensis]|uniref:transglutaminase TgpA family protein n=1 Tax=Virgibacillus dokdonensis TaxID=302167 RepID=UPI00098AD261|nr:transglutaminaseTgpA domain-containing protein [Virgibacillus dokdonensis]